MMRIGVIFIAVCIVLIAASLGLVAYLRFGLSGADAALIALGILVALVIYHVLSSRRRDHTEVTRHIGTLSRGYADLARQVADMSRDVAALDAKFGGSDKPRAAAQPLADEVEELSTLLKQVADQVALHEAALHAETGNEGVSTVPPAPRARPPAPLETAPPPATPKAPAGPTVAAKPAAPAGGAIAPFGGLDQVGAMAAVKTAIEAKAIELFLQPIVTLPQRRVRYYEALSRLQAENGDLVSAADFLPFAAAGGLMPTLDNLLLLRCVQIVRRLLLKNREVGLFCNLSMATLTDPGFPQMLEFAEANRAIAPSLAFEFAQAEVRGMGPIEHESLAALAECGFRFSMDNLTDLRIEPRELNERGFRFIKAPAALLLDRAGAAATDIHPADMSDLLGRFGIDLIADRIEAEGSVVDLLDYDVRFGQGFLFSPPRPVRAEALGGMTDLMKPETGTNDGAAPVRGLGQLARAGGRG